MSLKTGTFCSSIIYMYHFIQCNLSKLNPIGTKEFVQFRQVFRLHRFKLHRHLVDGTVKYVWLRQIFGLLRVQYIGL